MPQWTEQQRLAIEDRGHSLIVCAAAGSGKTAVLTERITRLVSERVSIGSMLIVTFTKAAAAEMRERIADSLREAAKTAEGESRKWIEEQCLLVGDAQISTLHSFCAALLRDNFRVLDIDPGFRIADAAECEALRAQAMDEALYNCYESGEDDFRQADLAFGEKQLAELAGELYKSAHKEPDPDAFYERSRRALTGTDDEILSGEAAQVILRKTKRELGMFRRKACRLINDNTAMHESYLRALTADCGVLEDLLSGAEGGFHSLSQAAKQASAEGKILWEPARASGKAHDKAQTEKAKRFRDAMKKAVQKRMALFLAGEPGELAADLRATLPCLNGIIGLAEEYGNLYREYKRQKNIFDFDDLEHEALRALSDPAYGVCQAAAEKYRYVFVDEYQDSSALQESILSSFATSIHRDSLFQVGDVKQSIYRFRQAEPSLFREKAAEYARPEREDALRIDLNANFRSRANILAGVNAVFSRLMRAEETEIEYDERERLYCGKEQRDDDPPLELLLVQRAKDGDGHEEALAVADRMKELFGTPLYDPKRGEMRPASWRDMCVLMRAAAGHAAGFAEVLSAEGIPVFCDVGSEYFEIPEVRWMIALLKVVDNPEDDYALLSALRGPAVGFTDEELAEIRIRAGSETSFSEALRLAAEEEDSVSRRAKQALDLLKRWRLAARHRGVGQLIRQILAESRIPLLSAALPDGKERMANLNLLETRALEFTDRQGGSLHAFLSFIERLHAGGDRETARALGEGEDVVRIMTIHKSKGLEFPIVFVADLARTSVRAFKRSALSTDSLLGAAIPCVDRNLSTVRMTLQQMAIAEIDRRKEIAEEIRVLYVAMTRAQDRLILSGTLQSENEMLRWQDMSDGESILSITDELDMICPTLMSAGASFAQDGEKIVTDGAAWSVRLCSPDPALQAQENRQAAQALRLMAEGEPDKDAAALYLYRQDPRLRVEKTSVSALIRDEKYRQEDPEESFLPVRTAPARPRFMREQGLTSAEIGTAFHRAVHAYDLSGLRASKDRDAEVEKQWVSLCQSGVLDDQEAAEVPVSMLREWFASSLGERMLSSSRVEREWMFTVRRKTGETRQVLQGVIDCCFLENGRWILVDYKTDQPRDIGAILERHRMQLSLYRESLEAITAIPVAESYLWLVRAGAAYPV